MSGWLLIWLLFAAGFFPLGYGIYILTNERLRERRDQRRAGIVFVGIGLVMVLRPVDADPAVTPYASRSLTKDF